MSLSDELKKLADLKESGALTEQEFQQAKHRLLNSSAQPPTNNRSSAGHDNSLGQAANRYVSFQIIMTVIGVIIFLLVIAPRMCSSSGPFGPNMHFR